MSAYTPTIGLEIHAELRTNTKMFCRSKNDPDESRPNYNICPVCLAHPGTLPVINREAVRHVLRVGVAIGATLADYTEFDRKSYFYPDLPKGYQLSQYEFPLVQGGILAGIPLTRIHLEEDTARSLHDESSGETVIDYNRAGVPLMELVTEPVIRSAEEAGTFARELQLLLRYLGVSEANMEKGQMRVEANVSVCREEGERVRGRFGTKVEVKNLNSFNAMERAVRFEIERQIGILEGGGTVAQETRGWDEARQVTFSQRIKEESADYRYFPDPDLPCLRLSELPGMGYEDIRKTLPELPAQRRARYVAAGVRREDADSFVKDTRFGDFFDLVMEEIGESAAKGLAPVVSNFIANDVVKIVRDIETRDSIMLKQIPLSASQMRDIARMFSEREISSRAAKDLLLLCAEEGGDARAVAARHGYLQIRDEAELAAVVDDVIRDNHAIAETVKAGKEKALEYLIGQAMRRLKGSGDPVTLRRIFSEKLK